MRVAIEGIGVVGGFGCGHAALRKALSAGCPTLSKVPLVYGSARGTEISALIAATDELDRFIPKRNLRRVDHYSKLALLGASLALEDAGLDTGAAKDMAIVVATGYGPHRTTFAFLDSFLVDGDTLSSPTQFTHSVHNAAAAHISIQLGLTGPALTVGQFETSVASALLTACCYLEQGQVDKVLFGAVDEYSDVLGYCWHHFFGPQTEGWAMVPLDFKVQSAVPGEGAAFLVLSGNPHKKPYGFIASVTTGDAGLIAADQIVPKDALVVAGADGHLETAPQYAALFEGRQGVACYTSLYGSFPVGEAFDLSIAALALKEGALFPSPQGTTPNTPSGAIQPIPACCQQICCVKYGRGGCFGSILVED